jgi:hypothetical protein
MNALQNGGVFGSLFVSQKKKENLIPNKKTGWVTQGGGGGI